MRGKDTEVEGRKQEEGLDEVGFDGWGSGGGGAGGGGHRARTQIAGGKPRGASVYGRSRF